MSFFIADALAQTAAPASGPANLFSLLFPIFLIAIFYFFIIRPQTKRAKEHKQMVEALKKGDEIVTGGGVLGRITDVGENFVLVEVTDGVQLRVQKASIGSLMPKGTLKGDL
jgi:preprotein translocase subunit YajC